MKSGSLVEVINSTDYYGWEDPVPVGSRGLVTKQCINPYYWTVYVDGRVVNMFEDDIKAVCEE